MSDAGDDDAFDDDETCVDQDVHNQLGDPLMMAQFQEECERERAAADEKWQNFKAAMEKDEELAELCKKHAEIVEKIPNGYFELAKAAWKRIEKRVHDIQDLFYK